MENKYPSPPIKVPRFEESAGFYTTEKRSKMMAKIRSENTKPELMFRKGLWVSGIRYRINDKKLPGKPDISNKSRKFVVFIDGEFWHGYNWKEKKFSIKSNRDFWIPKIERNIQRDAEVNIALKAMGFKVFRFWENEVKKELGRCINEILQFLHPPNFE